MSCFGTQASLTVCLACMADNNMLFPLNKTDISILDYLLHPYNKAYIENLKSSKSVRICAKCRLNIRNINTFRNIVLKNGLLLFQVSEFQEDKQGNDDIHQPATVNQSNIDPNTTLSTAYLELAVPVNKECPSQDPLLHEEIDIKHENEVKLENNDSQSSDDEEKPNENADDGERQVELETGIKVEENNSELCVNVTNVNLKNLNEMVRNMQASKPITSYAYNNPVDLPVLGMPCSGTVTQSRCLNPSLPRHPVHQVDALPTGPYLSTQGQRIILTPQMVPISMPANTANQPASQPGTTVQLGKLLLMVRTVPATRQNTASHHASDETKTGLGPIPGPSQKKTEKVKVKYKRKNKVVYRDLPLKYECSECDKKYRAKDNLKRHVEHFHMAQTVECTICSRTLMKNNLKWHMRQHEDSVYCQPCGKWYSPISYKVHVTSTTAHVAPDQYKFTCEDCGVKFHLKTTLARHRNRKHLNVEKAHKCRSCPKSFEFRRDLTRHVSSVHEKCERPRNFVCDICGVRMHSKTILSAHMVRHTGARPHACGVCGATFGYKAALFTHNRLKHAQGPTRKTADKRTKRAAAGDRDKSKLTKNKAKNEKKHD